MSYSFVSRENDAVLNFRIGSSLLMIFQNPTHTYSPTNRRHSTKNRFSLNTYPSRPQHESKNLWIRLVPWMIRRQCVADCCTEKTRCYASVVMLMFLVSLVAVEALRSREWRKDSTPRLNATKHNQ